VCYGELGEAEQVMVGLILLLGRSFDWKVLIAGKWNSSIMIAVHLLFCEEHAHPSLGGWKKEDRGRPNQGENSSTSTRMRLE
jgi:hypothetical protein